MPLDSRFWQRNAMCEFLAMFCADYNQLGRVQTYTDFCVWRNNYSILATNLNPVTAPHSGALLQTTTLNALQAVACSQRLTQNKKSVFNYASVGGAPEACGSRRVCVSVCVCVCMSFARISLQRIKTKC